MRRHLAPAKPKTTISAPRSSTSAPRARRGYNPEDLDLGSRMIAATQIVPEENTENPDWLVGAY